jgi:pimeloyl-ACP methyl ester carboxylesterase
VCLATSNRGDVGDLVLTGVPLLRHGSARRPSLLYRAMRGLNGLGLISDDRLEAEKRKRGSADYQAATGVMRDILVKVVNEEYPDQLAALSNEVHMIWGSADAEVPVDVARRALEIIGHGDLEVIEGVGHHLPLQAPGRLRSVVETLLT